MFTEERKDGRLIVVTGKTRSGKTAWTEQQTREVKRLLVWDAMAQWGDQFNCKIITQWTELLKYCKADAPDARLAVQCKVNKENFEIFCALAMIFLKLRVSTIVVEEIADVSSPAKASQNWGELLRKGLRYEPTIYALTQRPQESDKTMLTMASLAHCHHIAFLPDQTYIANNLLGVDVEKVAALKPLEYIEKDYLTGQIATGKVSFGPTRAPAKKAATKRKVKKTIRKVTR